MQIFVGKGTFKLFADRNTQVIQTSREIWMFLGRVPDGVFVGLTALHVYITFHSLHKTRTCTT